jgi:3-oxoacyl-[acyl-carrier protein] reductase
MATARPLADSMACERNRGAVRGQSFGRQRRCTKVFAVSATACFTACNNAGIATVAPIEEHQLAAKGGRSRARINVKGVFVAVQEAVRHMKESSRIINIGSINSDLVPFVGGSVYALTKSALAGFTRGLARDLGPRGITVNNVQPGPGDTDMNPADGWFASQVKGMIAVQRYGRGDEIAGLVAFLAGPEAAFITGASLRIDGGFAA